MSAVTWLFVPGDRPGRFAKAQAAGADAVVCDLEDGVAPQDKAQARAAVGAWLAAGGRAWVRVNAPGSELCDGDVEALAGLPGLLGLVVPKSEKASDLEDVAQRGRGCPIIALVETAVGVLEATGIARSPAVERLAFGSIDYAGDIDAVESEDSLLLARSLLVLASRAARKPGPLDGVTTDVLDMAPVQAAAVYARGLGFAGKLCIHPRQVAAVAAGFGPDEQDVRWAREVVSAGASGGAVAVRGQMVDRPVLERARGILAQVEARDERNPS
jgi:citrate lyase subunit beta / citryl-CoA lyase